MFLSKTAHATLDPVRIEGLARSFGEELGGPVVADLVRFGSLFFRWNARINLSGVRTVEEFVDRHLVDAFAAARFVSHSSRVVDVGSGGGLPIIPLALLRPTSRFELFESTAKKVAFLRTAVRELGMGDRVRVHAARIGLPCPAEFSGGFDVACSRATFPVAQWLELGRTLVRPQGQVMVFGTGSEASDVPAPTHEFVYALDRRLLMF